MSGRTVAEIMTVAPLVAVADETLRDAADRMAARRVGSVVVVEGNRPVGILTERDLLRAAAAGADPAATTVRGWMTADPDCVDPDTTIDDAWRQLGERGYRHIPVVAGGEFKGIVSMRDLMAVAQLRPAAEAPMVAPPGLKGVIVAETALGDVRGNEGFFHYREYSAPDLAAARTFEDVWHLFAYGSLPTPAEVAEFRAQVAPLRTLPPALREALPVIASSTTPMVALRTALSMLSDVEEAPASLDMTADEGRALALRVAAVVPTIVAAVHRLRQGQSVVEPEPTLGHAANYLYMLTGAPPPAEEARAVEQYLVLALDHGFNASTFTSRVVTSTGADLVGAVVSAVSALSGPLHGGAIHRALETLDAIGSPAAAPAWVREAVLAGRTIMGFGHPVYRTKDPRSEMLREVGLRLGGPRIELAVEVEAVVERTLAELKPGRHLHANIEWYASVVLERCGLQRDLFTSTFALTRVVGWCAQILEQAADNRIIRPSARYVGPPAPQPVP